MNNRSLRLTLAAMLAATALPAPGQPGAGANLADSTGTGPFSSIKEIDPGLPDQVVYRPADLGALGDTKLGIYAFGNGGCSDDAASARQHLLEIASHGYVAIAPGGIYSGPGASERPPGPPRDPAQNAPTRPEQLREASTGCWPRTSGRAAISTTASIPTRSRRPASAAAVSRLS